MRSSEAGAGGGLNDSGRSGRRRRSSQALGDRSCARPSTDASSRSRTWSPCVNTHGHREDFDGHTVTAEAHPTWVAVYRDLVAGGLTSTGRQFALWRPDAAVGGVHQRRTALTHCPTTGPRTQSPQAQAAVASARAPSSSRVESHPTWMRPGRAGWHALWAGNSG